MNCQKRRFTNKAIAMLELDRINRRHGHERLKTPRRVYRCSRCGGFHLTSRERVA